MLWSTPRRRSVRTKVGFETLEHRTLLTATGLDLPEANTDSAEVAVLTSEPAHPLETLPATMTGTWRASLIDLDTVQTGKKIKGNANFIPGGPVTPDMKVKGTIKSTGNVGVVNLRFSIKAREGSEKIKIKFNILGNVNIESRFIQGILTMASKGLPTQEFGFTASVIPPELPATLPVQRPVALSSTPVATDVDNAFLTSAS